jgi:hypothetical protein
MIAVLKPISSLSDEVLSSIFRVLLRLPSLSTHLPKSADTNDKIPGTPATATLGLRSHPTVEMQLRVRYGLRKAPFPLIYGCKHSEFTGVLVTK